VGTVTRDLREAIARFDAAANPRITYRGIDWAEFESFLSSCIAIERAAEQLILPVAVEQQLTALRFIRRKLRTIPITPTSELLRVQQYLDMREDFGIGELQPLFEECDCALESLLEGGRHPAEEFLIEQVRKMRTGAPGCAIHVVVSRDSIADMAALSNELDLGLSVTDLTGAKRVDVGEACFVFGSPESLLGVGLHWMDNSEAERKVAWLFNAPIAREVCVVSWPGNRAFKVDRYSIFPGTRLEVSSSTGREIFTIESTTEYLSRYKEAAPIVLDDGVPPHELVEARAVQLAGGLWVYYAVGAEGPRPNRVTESDFELAIEDVTSISQLREGDRLVVRDGDASRRFLEAEAESWLTEEYGESEPEACFDVRDRFRNGMQSLESRWSSVQNTIMHSFSADEMRYRFRLSHDRTHIAPESEEVYRKLSEAFGDKPTPDDWEKIRHLRSAMKRAGRIARQKMETRIIEDDSWNITVDLPDAAVIEMGELGSLVISRILQVLTDPVRVPISRLGQIQRSTR
jgi:hypothetical protein